MSKKGNLKFYKYKDFVIAIVIIIIVIILDIIFENYSKSAINKINGNIEKIYEIFDSENTNYDTKRLEKLSNNSIKEWEKRERNLACFVEHEEIEKVNVKLHILNAEIKSGNWNNAKSTTAETKQLVKYLNVKHKLSLQNLF